MILWRMGRAFTYQAIGTVRPGWRHALPFLLARDRYSDKGTFAVPIYADPRFDTNLRAIEAEMKRVRRGEPPRPFELPHDFPPGARESLRDLIGH